MREGELLDVLADIERDYPIDRERIYGFSVCFGASTLLRFAAHHPDLFAAIGLFSPEIGQVWGSRRPMESAGGAELAGNLANTHLLVMLSRGDTVFPVSTILGLVKGCRAMGMPAEAKIMAGGSHSETTEDIWEALWAFTKDKRQVPAPRQVAISAWHARYGKAYWARITGVADPSRLATLRATVDAPSRIRAATTNVSSFELLRDKMPTGMTPAIAVVTDGCPQTARFDGRKVAVRVRTGGTAARLAGTLARIDGPMSNAFAGPFLVVEGTQGTAAQRAGARATGRALRAAWRDDFFVSCRSKTDAQVTADDLARYNLVLLGTPAGNSVFHRLARALPIAFRPDEIRLGAKVLRGRDLTIEAVIPHPLSATRLVVVIGSNAGEAWKLPGAEPWLADYDYAVYRKGSLVATTGKYAAEARPTVPTRAAQGGPG